MLFDKLLNSLKRDKNDNENIDFADIDDDEQPVGSFSFSDAKSSYSDKRFDWILSSVRNKSDNDCILDIQPYTSDFQRIFLLDGEKKLQKRIADIYLCKLKNSDIDEIIDFSYRCRGGWYETDIFFWNESYKNASFSRSKFSHLNNEQYAAMLWVGCFDSNGYCRENCLNELGTSMAEFYSDKHKTRLSCIMPLMLRMSDNVEIIEKKAFSLSVSAVKNADIKNFSIYLPVLEHLSRSARVNNLNFQYISDIFADKLKKEFSAMDVTDIAKKITEPKSLLLRFAGKYPVFSYEQTKSLISTVRNEQQKISLFRSMITFYKDSFSPDEYLSDKCRRIRYTAANYKYETEGLPWDGLYDALLDSSSSLRELAVYVLKKHYGLNAHDYYSDKLGEAVNSGNISLISVCINGISEYGGKDDIPLIEQYLNAEDQRLRKSAIIAYGKIMGINGSDIYWEHITNDSGSGMIAAFRMTKKYHVHYPEDDIYDLCLDNIGNKRGEIAAKLLLPCDTWKKLMYALELCDNEALPLRLRQNMLSFLQSSHSYTEKPDSAEAQKIYELLEQKKEKITYFTYRHLRHQLKYFMK